MTHTTTAKTLSRLARLLLTLLALALLPNPAAAQTQTAGQRIDPETGERLPGVRPSENLAPGLPARKPAAASQQQIDLRAYLREGATRLARVAGTTFYANDGTLFKTFDVSNPADPQLLDTLALPALPSDAVISGGRAYVAAGPSLRILDVSDPADLQELGAVALTNALGVALDGDYAYVSNGPTGTSIIDVSDPGNPVEVSTLPSNGSSNGLDVDAAKDMLYIADGGGGLLTADVSDPAAPDTLGSYDAGGFVTFASYSDGTAYIVGGFGFTAVDVSDPANPVALGTYSLDDTAFEVTVANDVAYVGGGQGGFYALDVSDLTAPSLLGSFASGGSVQSLDLSGDDVFLAERYNGLRVLDASDPGNPTSEAFLPGGGFSFFADIDGDVAYVTDIFGRLRLIDVSDPDNPQVLSRLNTLPTNTQRVKVRDGLAYVTDADSGPTGLSIVDVSDPTDPQILSTFNTVSQSFGLDLDGDVAYIANGFGGVLAVDISDPTAPSVLGSLPLISIRDVEVAEDVVYAVSFGQGLTAIDASDPSNLSELGSFSFGFATDGDFMSGIAIAADTAYLATGAGFDVLDISDPANIAVLGRVSTPSTGARDVTVAGDRAYLAVDFVGVRQYDVSDAANPFEDGFLPSADRLTGLGEERGLLIAAAGGGGAYVIEETVPLAASFRFETRVDTPSTGQYAVTPQMRANDDEGLGDATLAFSYDPAGLSYPATPAAGTDFAFADGFDGDCYAASTVTRPAPGEILVDVAYALGDPGCEADGGTHLAKSLTDVVTLTFDITDRSALSDLTWDTAATQAFTDDAAPAPYQNDAFSGQNDVLPVELASFGAALSGGEQVALTWRTLSEANNDGFRIERRQASGAWERVAFVESQAPGGTSTEALRYRFEDAALPFEAQQLTYRLVQRDLDGATRPAGAAQTVELGAPEAFALKAPFPNPVREQATLRYTLPQERAVTLELFDALGRKVRTLVDAPQVGQQEARLETGALSSGAYFVRLVAGDFVATRQIVVVQ